MKNLSAAAFSVILALVITSLGCGGGNHLVSIAVSPNPADLTAPETLQLQAIGSYRDGTTKMLPSATWTFSRPSSDFNVDSNGVATCQVPGGPALGGTVTASLAGVSGSAILHCSGNPLVSITVNPNPVDLTAPQTLQLQAIGTYSDGTTKVLSSATWTSSVASPAVAVDSKGLATCGVSGGPANTTGTVTASFAGVSGSAVLSCSGPGA